MIHRPTHSLQVRRRHFLAALGAAGFFFTQRGAFADALVLTPSQTLGPYYPDQLPMDQDNDLLLINDAITPAVGTVSWVSGRILDRRGEPLRNALVEIWQADINGAYIHSQSTIRNRDVNFQGYGRFLTGSTGEYLFRTVLPGLYPGRTRHIHYQVTLPGGRKLATQLYREGQAENARDGVLSGIRDTAQRASVVRPWTPVEDSPVGALAVSFDVVMDFTPDETVVVERPTLVAAGGVVHAADEQAVAPAGAWLHLYGQGLSATTRTRTAEDIVDGALPLTLDGVGVSINGQAVPVDSVSPGRIRALAPDLPGEGALRVEITNSQGTSDAVEAALRTYAPAFQQYPGQRVAARRAEGRLVAPPGLFEDRESAPAVVGETITLLGSGFGPGDPPAPFGQEVTSAVPLAAQVRLQLDELTLEVLASRIAAPGVYEFDVRVPEVAPGDHLLTAEAGGVRTAVAVRLVTALPA